MTAQPATPLLKPHRAKPELLGALGFPTEAPVDWKSRAIGALNRVRKARRSVQLGLDLCTRCGACAEQCHVYLGTRDPLNMPVARAELLRSVYRRYCTASGKLFGPLAGPELDEHRLDVLYSYFSQCSECRRCATACPLGVDTAELTMAAREMLASIGIVSKYVAEVIRKAHQIGNNMGIPEAAWRDSCEFLEEELKEAAGATIRLPVNEKGAQVLLVPPSADLFANTDTMMGYARMFHSAGISWTTSTYASEAGNFGLFLDSGHMARLNRRMVDAARELGAKRIVMGECGHAWRVAQAFTDSLNGPLDFLDAPRPQHISELACELLDKDALRLDPSANDQLSVSYHDPCNLARAGGLMEEPRRVLRAVVRDFREMPADTIRARTFCCGAGGGMLADELMEVRMKSAAPRVEAFRSTGANFLVTSCAICKAQLPPALEYYKVEAKVGGVMDLLGNAILCT